MRPDEAVHATARTTVPPRRFCDGFATVSRRLLLAVDETDPRLVVADEPDAQILVLVDASVEVLTLEAARENFAEDVGNLDGDGVGELGVLVDDAVDGGN